jgi:hypothetical protein
MIKLIKLIKLNGLVFLGKFEHWKPSISHENHGVFYFGSNLPINK